MFLLLLLCILLAWFLSQKLYARYWCNGLSVEIEFQERFLYEGDTSAMKEIVVNDKLLPLPALEIRFSSNRNLEFLSEASANTNSTDRSFFPFSSIKGLSGRCLLSPTKGACMKFST